MRRLLFLLLLLLVFTGVAALDLRSKGLLTRDALDVFVGSQVEREEPPPVEPVGLAASIWDWRGELQEREEGLQKLSSKLESQRKELEADRADIERRLEKLKAEFQLSGAGRAGALSEEMALLVKMYENMPPEDAAAVLDNLPDSTVAQLLLQMRGRQAAQIMGELETNKAAEVSKLLVIGDGVKKLSRPETGEAPG